MVGDHLQNVGEVLALGGEFHHFFLLCLGHGHATGKGVVAGAELFDRVRGLLDLRAEFLRSEEHTSELQSRLHLVCRLLLEKKKTTMYAGRAMSPPCAGRSRACRRPACISGARPPPSVGPPGPASRRNDRVPVPAPRCALAP